MNRISLKLLPCLLACLFALQAADTIVGGPYAINVGPRSATIGWVVQTAEVRIGTSVDNLDRGAPALQCRRVTYNNLKPGTTYSYNVSGEAFGAGSFKTAPVGDAAFRFAVYGDTRTRHELHQKIADAVAATAPDFVVHTGDLVADGADTAQWPTFFRIERALLRGTAFFPVMGNHEHSNRQYFDFFVIDNPYYSFNWGGAHVALLDTEIATIAPTPAGRERFWAEQKAWLEQDLEKAAAARFRFLVFHHPPITAMKRRQKDNPEVQALMPLFERYKVTAVFSGHDHDYQHHLKNGIHYVVTGGGGAPLYDLDAPIPGVTLKVEKVEHYVRVDVDGTTARVEAVALDGHTIDKFEMK